MAEFIVGTAFLCTYPGLLKLVELILMFISFVLMVSVNQTDASKTCYLIAAIASFCGNLFLILIYVKKAVERWAIKVVKFEFCYTIFWGTIYLLVSLMLLLDGQTNEFYSAAIFGLVITLLYALESMQKYTFLQDFCAAEAVYVLD